MSEFIFDCSMKYLVILLILISTFVLATNLAYAQCEYDPSQPHKPCDDTHGTLIIETNQAQIENIDGVLYYVSESFMLESSTEMVSFHDVIFTMPYTKPPPRYIYSNVTFSDGTKETLRVIHDEYDFTDHADPQAGFKQNSGGYIFLVSTGELIPPHDPYADDESLLLASEKKFVSEETMGGGSGIGFFDESNFQLSTVIIAIIIGVGSGIGLTYYLRKRK